MKEIFDKHEGIIDLIAVDTGAGETYIQPRMQRLLTDVEASKSHAIGVGGTVQRATAKGRMSPGRSTADLSERDNFLISLFRTVDEILRLVIIGVCCLFPIFLTDDC